MPTNFDCFAKKKYWVYMCTPMSFTGSARGLDPSWEKWICNCKILLLVRYVGLHFSALPSRNWRESDCTLFLLDYSGISDFIVDYMQVFILFG
jgi:hypothetical protein